MTDLIDLREEKRRRSNSAADWTVKECIASLHQRLNLGLGDKPDYLEDADAVVMVFTKRYPDGSSEETIIQAGTVSGNEAIGILTCGIAILTRVE